MPPASVIGRLRLKSRLTNVWANREANRWDKRASKRAGAADGADARVVPIAIATWREILRSDVDCHGGIVRRHVGGDDDGDDDAVVDPDPAALSGSRRRKRGPTRLGGLTAVVGIAYFVVWTLFGIAAFPLGVSLVSIEMRQPALARAVPIAIGLVVLIAGVLQFTAWKARHLACCRDAPECALPADAGTAWLHGLRIGVHCSLCCAGLMAILLVAGVMNLGAMAAVAAVITVERFAPTGERAARVVGAAIVALAVFLIARAAAVG